MRDIRQDLKERISSLTKEVDELERLLDRENMRWAVNQHSLPLDQPNNSERKVTVRKSLNVQEYIIESISEKPLSKKEITQKAVLDRIFADTGMSPGRVIHLTITNMVKGGSVKERSDGKYVPQ